MAPQVTLRVINTVMVAVVTVMMAVAFAENVLSLILEWDVKLNPLFALSANFL